MVPGSENTPMAHHCAINSAVHLLLSQRAVRAWLMALTWEEVEVRAAPRMPAASPVHATVAGQPK